MHTIFVNYTSIKLRKEKKNVSFTWIKLLSWLGPYLARKHAVAEGRCGWPVFSSLSPHLVALYCPILPLASSWLAQGERNIKGREKFLLDLYYCHLVWCLLCVTHVQMLILPLIDLFCGFARTPLTTVFCPGLCFFQLVTYDSFLAPKSAPHRPSVGLSHSSGRASGQSPVQDYAVGSLSGSSWLTRGETRVPLLRKVQLASLLPPPSGEALIIMSHL